MSRDNDFAAETYRKLGLVPDELPMGRMLSNVEPERVEWFWDRRIPFGKITVVDGDPGLGKSVLTTDLAARLSVGRPFPDGQPCAPAASIIVNYEDGEGDTIRPRLDAAGGDPKNVMLLAAVPDGPDSERFISVPDDIPILEANIKRLGARFVVIDPLMAAFSPHVNGHKDQDVRRALSPLKAMAERTGAAVVLVRHPTKNSGSPAIYRGGGSIGIIGAARSGLVVGVDPEDESRRVLASQKSNLCEYPESLAYRIVGAANGSARIEYAGRVATNADTLLGVPLDPEERSELARACEFLRYELAKSPVYGKSLIARAKEDDIAERTLNRAKKVVGVVSKHEAGGGWYWSIPAKPESKVAT